MENIEKGETHRQTERPERQTDIEQHMLLHFEEASACAGQSGGSGRRSLGRRPVLLPCALRTPRTSRRRASRVSNSTGRGTLHPVDQRSVSFSFFIISPSPGVHWSLFFLSLHLSLCLSFFLSFFLTFSIAIKTAALLAHLHTTKSNSFGNQLSLSRRRRRRGKSRVEEAVRVLFLLFLSFVVCLWLGEHGFTFCLVGSVTILRIHIHTLLVRNSPTFLATSSYAHSFLPTYRLLHYTRVGYFFSFFEFRVLG